jgi:hypothetical protein
MENMAGFIAVSLSFLTHYFVMVAEEQSFVSFQPPAGMI